MKHFRGGGRRTRDRLALHSSCLWTTPPSTIQTTSTMHIELTPIRTITKQTMCIDCCRASAPMTDDTVRKVTVTIIGITSHDRGIEGTIILSIVIIFFVHHKRRAGPICLIRFILLGILPTKKILIEEFIFSRHPTFERLFRHGACLRRTEREARKKLLQQRLHRIGILHLQ